MEDYLMESIFALVLGIVGASLGMIAKKVGESQKRKPESIKVLMAGDTVQRTRYQPATLILSVFALVVLAFGLLTAFLNWEKVIAEKDSLFFGAWLFLAMVGGMFAQVLWTNTKEGSDFSNVSASQLLFPLLFSIMVFYPIWAVGTSASNNFFAIYAAFVNGYFWKTVVANTKIPAPATNENKPKDSPGK
jgi:hypothetical protein